MWNDLLSCTHSAESGHIKEAFHPRTVCQSGGMLMVLKTGYAASLSLSFCLVNSSNPTLLDILYKTTHTSVQTADMVQFCWLYIELSPARPSGKYAVEMSPSHTDLCRTMALTQTHTWMYAHKYRLFATVTGSSMRQTVIVNRIWYPNYKYIHVFHREWNLEIWSKRGSSNTFSRVSVHTCGCMGLSNVSHAA